ncbi:hypothetical protein ACPBEH_10335 [Latilactobacillus sp. 5-91]|uniref:YobI family P-loop NTPase n=1 Tax=Latilactobacillus sp. 5-91 TaxID=3410924 RepID=UPI003C76C18E
MGDVIYLENLRSVNDRNLGVYKTALDLALEDKKNFNIALSGSYGSGKSSIIESYKNYDDVKYRFLHISLAQYESPESGTSDEGKDTNSQREKELEGKILNQLLHQIKLSKIPQTIFKVKRKISRISLLLASISIPLMIIFVSYLVWFNNWKSFFEKNFKNSQLFFIKFIMNLITNSNTWLVIFFIVVFITVVYVYKFIQLQVNKGIVRKISIKGNDIEVFKESKESYFDKYLNDVIYLFENSDVDVVVFEDIDRYNNVKIFEKLKEINTLVNKRNKSSKSQIKFIKYIRNTKFFQTVCNRRIIKIVRQKFRSKKRIVFLYLLRDDMFISKDRTKFFDIIIPVVPVIDSSNSYEKIIELFDRVGLEKNFDRGFLQKLSLYIDDMRLLKNIYNEYLIYYEELNSINLNSDKLLALITYKNIFPRDFSNLQLSKGFVYSLFTQYKVEIIQKKIAKLEDDISQIDKELEAANDEEFTNISELIALYFTDNNLYQVNDKTVNDFETTSDFAKELMIADNNWEKRESYDWYSWVPVSGKDILIGIEQKKGYSERKKNIEIKNKKRQEAILEKRNELKEKIELIKLQKLNDLVSKSEIEQYKKEEIIGGEIDFSEIKQNDYFLLLVFLVRNGYLDESYPDYMTYFYPNTLAQSDKLYLRSITDENALNYNYALINIEEVMRRMDTNDYMKKEVLNYDLFCFMLGHLTQYEDSLNKVIGSLIKEKNIEFIKSIFIRNRKKQDTEKNENMIGLLFLSWNGFAKQLLSGNEKINDLIIEVALNTLDYTSINNQNEENVIINYLENSNTFLARLDGYNKLLISNLEKLSVKFNSIDFSKINSEVAENIYQKNLYRINFYNLNSIFTNFHNIKNKQNIAHKNYSLVKSVGTKHLIDYVTTNIELYVNVILNNSENVIQDEENYAYEIINNEQLSEVTIVKYIRALKTRLNTIEKIDNEGFWEILIKQNGITLTENNLVEYYHHYNDDSWSKELIQFVNQNKMNIKVNLTNVNTKYGRIGIFFNTIKEYQLKNNKYASLLISMKSSDKEGDLEGVNTFSIVDVPSDKMSLLIDNRIIEMKKETLTGLRKNYPDKIIMFIQRNLEKYYELIQNDELYDPDEILQVLDENMKIETAQSIKENISIISKNYSDELLIFILKNKFNINDLNGIISNYTKYSVAVQKVIRYVVVGHIEIILTNKIKIEYLPLLEHLLGNIDVEINIRKQLFSNNIKLFDKEQVKKYLSKLNFSSKFISLFDGKRPLIEITDENTNILQYLKFKGWISSYREENIEFRVIGRKEYEK